LLALLKNEWSIRFIILLAGVGLGFKLFYKPQTSAEPVAQAQKQSQDCKIKVVKVTNPDGTTQESVEISAKSEQSQEQKPPIAVKKDNIFIASDQHEHGIYYRPDGLPIHIGVEYNRNSNEIKAKAGLSLRLDF